MSAPAAAWGGRGSGEELNGRVVEDLLAFDDSAVSVGRVLAEAHVGDDQQVRDLPLDRPDGALNRCLRVPGSRPRFVFAVGKAKEEHGTDAVASRAVRFRDGLVDGELKYPGHRGDLMSNPLPGPHKEWVDQLLWSQSRLADEITHGGRSAKATEAVGQLKRHRHLSCCPLGRRKMGHNRFYEGWHGIGRRHDCRPDAKLRRGIGRHGTD